MQSNLAILVSSFAIALLPNSLDAQPNVAPPALPASDAAASSRYVALVNRELDLLGPLTTAGGYLRAVNRFEAGARRITKLPTKSVSPELIKYGSNIADLLREEARMIRRAAAQVHDLERQRQYRYYQDPPQVSYYWGGSMGGPMFSPPTGTPTWTWGAYPGNIHYIDNFAEINARQQVVETTLETELSRVKSEIEQERAKMQLAVVANQ